MTAPRQTNIAFLTKDEAAKIMYEILSLMYMARNITLDANMMDEQFRRIDSLMRDIDTSQYENWYELKCEAAKEIGNFDRRS